MFEHYLNMLTVAGQGIAFGAPKDFPHFRVRPTRNTFFDIEMLRAAFYPDSCSAGLQCGCRSEFVEHAQATWGIERKRTRSMLQEGKRLQSVSDHLWKRVVRRAEAALENKLPQLPNASPQTKRLALELADIIGQIFASRHEKGRSTPGECVLMFCSGIARMALDTRPIPKATPLELAVPTSMFNAEANGRDLSLLCELAAMAEEAGLKLGKLLPHTVIGLHLMYRTYGTVQAAGRGDMIVGVNVLDSRIRANRDPRPTPEELDAWMARAQELAKPFGTQSKPKRILESVWGATLQAGELHGRGFTYEA